MTVIDLDAYLRRIAWDGTALRPDLATLARLLAAHMRAIPFENLDVLAGRPVRIDPASVAAKLVDERRGGYCFEHMTLFAEVLRAIGMPVSCHLARVVLFTPLAEAARTHMFGVVDLPEGRHVVDPGFGGPASTVPVPLDGERRGGACHWFERRADHIVLRTGDDDGPRDLWASTLGEDLPIDFVLSNHYVATHPASVFVGNLMLNRFTETGRIAVLNRTVTSREGDHRESWTLPDRAALRDLLARHFDIDLPGAESLAVPACPDWA